MRGGSPCRYNSRNQKIGKREGPNSTFQNSQVTLRKRSGLQGPPARHFLGVRDSRAESVLQHSNFLGVAHLLAYPILHTHVLSRTGGSLHIDRTGRLAVGNSARVVG